MSNRLAGILVILVMFAVVSSSGGCTSGGQTGGDRPTTHRIVGRWVLDLEATSPAAAQHPELAKEISSEIFFHPDGRYDSSSRFGPNGPAGEAHGTYRVVGDDVYTTIEGHEAKLQYEIRGGRLIVYDKPQAGAMIYRRP